MWGMHLASDQDNTHVARVDINKIHTQWYIVYRLGWGRVD